MKSLMFAAISLMPVVAIAQQVPMPPQQPSEYNLKVTPADIDLISKGLGTQPFNDVVPLISKLRAQVMEQQPKPIEPPKAEVEKK